MRIIGLIVWGVMVAMLLAGCGQTYRLAASDRAEPVEQSQQQSQHQSPPLALENNRYAQVIIATALSSELGPRVRSFQVSWNYPVDPMDAVWLYVYLDERALERHQRQWIVADGVRQYRVIMSHRRDSITFHPIDSPEGQAILLDLTAVFEEAPAEFNWHEGKKTLALKNGSLGQHLHITRTPTGLSFQRDRGALVSLEYDEVEPLQHRMIDAVERIDMDR